MAKLDIGIGEDFPVEENKTQEDCASRRHGHHRHRHGHHDGHHHGRFHAWLHQRFSSKRSEKTEKKDAE